MVSVTKGSWARRRSTKRRDEEKSTTQGENHNNFTHQLLQHISLII